MIRPTDGVVVRGDRARPGARHGAATTAVAFRVHYQYDIDPSLHYVSEDMWEHEAVDFANKVDSFPGMSLVATVNRPRGIETIRGYERLSKASAFADSTSYLIAKAKRLAVGARDALTIGEFEAASGILAELAEFTTRQPVQATQDAITAAVASILSNWTQSDPDPDDEKGEPTE